MVHLKSMHSCYNCVTHTDVFNVALYGEVCVVEEWYGYDGATIVYM
jgi:hypothetical protein